MKRKTRIFKDYKDAGVDELWDTVRFWATLWASVSADFRD